MKVSELNNLVLEEAKALKESATKLERRRLDINGLKATTFDNCIYGQMTGHCFGSRAIKLIERCAPKLLNGKIGFETTSIEKRTAFEGKKREQAQECYTSSYHWSPIEVFITRGVNQKNGNNECLVAFLKGQTDSLILK